MQTPIELPAVHASRRLFSYLVDYTIVLTIGVPVAARAGLQGNDVQALLGVVYFTYFFLLEGAAGLTIGKLLVNTRVVRKDGSALGWNGAALRSLSRLVPFEPLSYRVGTLWHDRWTGTRVVSRAVARACRDRALRANEPMTRLRPSTASAPPAVVAG